MRPQIHSATVAAAHSRWHSVAPGRNCPERNARCSPALPGQNGRTFRSSNRRALVGKKSELAIDGLGLCAFSTSLVTSIASQVMRLSFVRQLDVKNTL